MIPASQATSFECSRMFCPYDVRYRIRPTSFTSSGCIPLMPVSFTACSRAEVDSSILEAGEQAVYETGIKGMHPELVKLVGRMRYRTSYGQNILEHSKEVAWLAGIIAAELKLDVQLAKRGALLHDVGKVLTHEHDGTHVQLGVEVATKHGEHPIVINCIAAHHDDVAHESPISVIVQAADAVSGSRPGARREAFETYVKRLTQLEQLASEFAGEIGRAS